jgi:hypothetical protein
VPLTVSMVRMPNPWLDIPLEDYEGHMSPVMKLIAPAELSRLAVATGFAAAECELIELPSGKQFSLQTFRA